jgi:hypothetical protein
MRRASSHPKPLKRVPIRVGPFAVPVYWRNGFERRDYLNLDTKETENATIDVGLFENELLQGNVKVAIKESDFGTGKYALHVKGAGEYKIASAKISCYKPMVFNYAASSEKIKVGVVLETGRSKFVNSGEAFTVMKEICGIAVRVNGGEGFLDDIELKEV